MPRIPRGETAGGIYHVINRGNMRMQVFDDAGIRDEATLRCNALHVTLC
ncbi:MAG: hypothetical protein JXK05_07475 [Campylobacterales bacterium]|nr:hypothetical protein [Campylobacterales bacterium]